MPLFIAFIITNFGKARVFGEAERYIEFGYPLQLTLFLTLIANQHIDSVLFLMLVYNLVWYGDNLYQLKHQNKLQYSYGDLCCHLSNNNVNLLCLNNNESYFFLKTTNVNIVGFFVNISLKNAYRDFFYNFFSRYPLVNHEYIKEIREKYKVTHILENKKIEPKEKIRYRQAIESLYCFSKVYDDQRYVPYKKKK